MAEPSKDMDNGDELFLEPTPAATDKGGKKARTVPALVEDAVSKGIRVYVSKTGFDFDGFYKGGPIRVETDPQGGLVAVDRKDKKVPLKSFDDLVKLNYDWWKKSRERSAEHMTPEKEWLDEFVRLNLVKRQVIFIPGDD